MTELYDWDTEQEGKCCSAGNPHYVYSVSSLCSSLDLKALSDPALDLQGRTTTTTDIISNARSSSDFYHNCRSMHIQLNSMSCSHDSTQGVSGLNNNNDVTVTSDYFM